jgi:hypothetical protein
MSANDLESSSDQNVCATCLNLTCETDEFASTILTTDNVSSAVHAPDREVEKVWCGGTFGTGERAGSRVVRA